MLKYCESGKGLIRRPTREVLVGNVGIGGNNPIRVQSMTTSDTKDAKKTIEQIVRLQEAGCEIVRVTVQGIKEADTCEQIKNGLIQRGINIPIAADIHFFPPAALRVVDFVDKVRINPGNFSDKRASFKVIEYDDITYAKELERIEEKFVPLVEKCKKLKKALRIGTNHGSLSDRVLNRYGDTPAGMVESAFEFARVCRKHDFHQFIFSMKSSNPQVMVNAYRLLASEMYKLGWDYPLHLGVTEAGLGEDGRIKSAMGIGTLLLEGLGDTIRVSLTEDAWHEIDPCRRLVNLAREYSLKSPVEFNEKHRDFQNILKRQVAYPKHISFHKNGSVFVQADKISFEEKSFYEQIDCGIELGRPKIKNTTVDGLIFKSEEKLKELQDLETSGIAVFMEGDLKSISEVEKKKFVNKFSLKEDDQPILLIDHQNTDEWEKIASIKPSIIVYRPTDNYVYSSRMFFDFLKERAIKTPVVLNFKYDCSEEDLIIRAAAEYGALLIDGLGDGIYIEGPYKIDFLRKLSFNILQAARMRIFKTDFISCPSCGRTLFDLQDVTKRIKTRTEHLAGVKIAIMGCIVNGPGEMADADFGYVGSKAGMIDLYIGEECVQKDIPFAEADDRLVDLIKSQGKWIEA